MLQIGLGFSDRLDGVGSLKGYQIKVNLSMPFHGFSFTCVLSNPKVQAGATSLCLRPENHLMFYLIFALASAAVGWVGGKS